MYQRIRQLCCLAFVSICLTAQTSIASNVFFDAPFKGIMSIEFDVRFTSNHCEGDFRYGYSCFKTFGFADHETTYKGHISVAGLFINPYVHGGYWGSVGRASFSCQIAGKSCAMSPDAFLGWVDLSGGTFEFRSNDANLGEVISPAGYRLVDDQGAVWQEASASVFNVSLVSLPEVPLPASGWLLFAGLAGLSQIKRVHAGRG